jgi:hypothetical protein
MRSLLITGEYGAGKTAVAAEITHLLAERGVPSAGIDLDWLCWVGPDLDPVALWRVKMGNLRAMVVNFASVGVERVVIAGALFDLGEREMVAGEVEPADLQVSGWRFPPTRQPIASVVAMSDGNWPSCSTTRPPSQGPSTQQA